MDGIEHVVFYGTLMGGNKTSIRKKMNSTLVHEGDCILRGELYSLGRMPALKPGKQEVKAELYRIVDKGIIPVLDAYEAVDKEDSSLPGFTRKLVELITPKLVAWVYFYDGDVQENQRITGNSWQPPTS